ncbi:MAG TPA: hypothetical protein VE553_02805 [Candidatus Binatia bacterium]|nr:hypothetical protein [Candidatus Binatia bacterium]
MFSPIFLLTLLPTWLAAMVLLKVLRRRQAELEEKQALQPIEIEQ